MIISEIPKLFFGVAAPKQFLRSRPTRRRMVHPVTNVLPFEIRSVEVAIGIGTPDSGFYVRRL